jgi:hypothetical protein
LRDDAKPNQNTQRNEKASEVLALFVSAQTRQNLTQTRQGTILGGPDDRTPVIRAMCDVGFPCILTPRRSPDEAQAIFRRADHFDLEGARGRRLGGVWYCRKGGNDGALRERLKQLAERYPKHGYPTLHDMLRIEGRVINRKRTYRIYREEGLQVRTKKRKKLFRARVPILLPDTINQRWSMDFVSDQRASGRRLRVLSVVTTSLESASCRSLISRFQAIDWLGSSTDSRGPFPGRSFAIMAQSSRRKPCSSGRGERA